MAENLDGNAKAGRKNIGNRPMKVQDFQGLNFNRNYLL
jgi:hypothetical protein